MSDGQLFVPMSDEAKSQLAAVPDNRLVRHALTRILEHFIYGNGGKYPLLTIEEVTLLLERLHKADGE